MLSLIFLVLAFVLFIVAGIGVAAGKLNLVALGLASWVASELVAHALR